MERFEISEGFGDHDEGVAFFDQESFSRIGVCHAVSADGEECGPVA